MLGPQYKDKFELISNLLFQGASLEDIGRVVGLAAADIKDLQDNNAEFQAIQSEILREKHESDTTRDQGWDRLEETALANVLETMQWNKDPEFALKAAMIANRANRRTARPANQALQAPANAGSRAVISLNLAFIQRLQSGALQPRTLEMVPNKQSDVLSPTTVENALFPKQQKAEEDDLLVGIDLRAAVA